MIDINDLLSKFEEAGPVRDLGRDNKGNQTWMVCCPHPNHDDTRPSCKVLYSDDGTPPGFYCYARGCDSREIQQHLGLIDGQVFGTYRPTRKPKTKTRKKPKRNQVGEKVHEATHEYLTPACTHEGERYSLGDHAFSVERFRTYYDDGTTDKDMPSWYMNGSDRKYSISKRPRPLYRTMELLEARPHEIWFLEGESNVDRAVEEYGIQATCINGGSNQSISEIGMRTLVDIGVRVVNLVMDNDPAGEKFANQIEGQLHEIDVVVNRFRAAIDYDGADISDHIDAGFGIEELIPFLSAYPNSTGKDHECAMYVAASCNGELLYISDLKKWLIYQNGIFRTGDHYVHHRISNMLMARWRMSLIDDPGVQKRKRLSAACEVPRVDRIMRSTRAFVATDLENMGEHVLYEHLPVSNGVINLRTKECLKHSPQYRFTKQANVKHNPEAKCPQWLSFLETVQPESDVRDLLQRFAGACATGHVVQAVFQFWGMGANGKSTFLSVLTSILNTHPTHGFAAYSNVATWIDFGQGRSGADHRSDLSRLRGARIVVASEPTAKGNLDVGQVKAWTGSEECDARKAHEGDTTPFLPQGTLVFQTNVPLRVEDPTDGLWRRMKLIPWEVQIPPSQQIKDLDKDLVREEAAGILNWVIEGAKMFLMEGLGPIPSSVSNATEQYQYSEDEFGMFLHEHTEKDPGGGFVEMSTLYGRYLDWCESNQIPKGRVLSKIAFGKTMTNRGYKKKRVHSGHAWDELHLITEKEASVTKT